MSARSSHRSRPRSSANKRLPSTTRLERRARRGKADVERNPIRRREKSRMRTKHWLGILVLAPVALITVLTLVEMCWRMIQSGKLWATEEFRFFGFGVLGFVAAYFLAGLRPVKLYVFGHEFSHYLMARLSGAKIYGFHFSSEGGYVETDKSSTLISLAPYLIPIYSLGVLALFGALGLFVEVGTVQIYSLGSMDLPWKWSRLMFVLLGASWAFHIAYTWITLRGTEQSDLTRNGEFFSLMLIFVTNAALLMAVFIVTSPEPELGLQKALQCWWGTANRWIPGL